MTSHVNRGTTPEPAAVRPVAPAVPRRSAVDIARALGLPPPTPEQRAVIEAPPTSMLIVAGAGSGKTETMTGRVVWLVANGLVAPERILGLTFTRKAAGELAERIGGRLRRLAATGLWAGPTVTDGIPAVPMAPGVAAAAGAGAVVEAGPVLEADALPTVATYHSYAGSLVREHGLRLGIEPDARLLTEAAAWQYAHEVVVRYDGPMDEVDNAESTVTAAVRDLAGQLAEHLCTVEDLADYLRGLDAHVTGLPLGSTRAKGAPAPVKELLAHVRAQGRLLPLLEAYARTKSRSESLDFADQMALAATLAELDPGVARAERDRYSVVLLDEFQDTSEAQMRLLHALFADPRAGATRPVTAVGDPHQSIYGWRGASATTLAAFPQRFTVPAGSLAVDPPVGADPGGPALSETALNGAAPDEPAPDETAPLGRTTTDSAPGATARAGTTAAEDVAPATTASATTAPATTAPATTASGTAPVTGGGDAVAGAMSTPRGSAEGDREAPGEVGATTVASDGLLVPPVLPLSTSWRNDVAVLDVANATAAPLSAASPVPVRELRPSPIAGEGVVEAARLRTAAEEAEYVADWIAAQWWEPGRGRRHSGTSAAVLCRRRAQFAAVADALGARGIPVEVVGLGGLLTRPEVSDVVSLLRVVHDPTRGDALMRLLVGPSVRLGAADLDALGAWSRHLHRRGRERTTDVPAAQSEHMQGEHMQAGDTQDADTITDSLTSPTTPVSGTPSTTGTSTSGAVGEAQSVPGDGTRTRPGAAAQAADTQSSEDDAEQPSLVEAVDTLPPPEWTGGQGEWLSPTARDRLARLSRAIDTLRGAVGHPLPELVVLAERTLGVDVEVAASLDTLPETARRHLDAFADAAAAFAYGADRPTLGGFLDWLDAARDEERGLDSPASHVAEGAVQVLTVHAAKGLEWDVVAVPGLVEAAFPSHRSYFPPSDGGLPSPTSKGWLTGLGSIPYDLRGDRDGLPRLPWQDAEDLTELAADVKRFAEEGGRHALEEERRLAYVAFTRARHRLLLSASLWLEGEKPRVTSRFLSELLDRPGLVRTLTWAPDPDPGETNPALTDTPGGRWPVVRDDPRDHADRLAAAWVRGAAASGRHNAAPRTMHGAASDPAEPDTAVGSVAATADPGPDSQDPRAGAAGSDDLDALLAQVEDEEERVELARLAGLVDLLLAERADDGRRSTAARLPGHLSTSALVEVRSDPGAFADRLRRPMPSPPATAARLGTAFHSWIEQHYRRASLVDDLDLDGYADEVEEVPDLERARRLFLASPWAEATPLEVEVALETVIAGLPVRGRIDAVFPREDGGVTIVDWKTGAPPSPERLAARSVQLAVYRLAYARWRDLPPEDVHAAFYYASTGTTIHPDLPDEADLVALVAGLTNDDRRDIEGGRP